MLGALFLFLRFIIEFHFRIIVGISYELRHAPADQIRDISQNKTDKEYQEHPAGSYNHQLLLPDFVKGFAYQPLDKFSIF